MKTSIKRWSVLLPMLLCSTCCISQAIADSVFLKMLDSDVLLPMIIDSAVKHAPSVQRTNHSIEMLKENTLIEKKALLSGISFLSSYNYGTAGDLTTGKDVGSVNQYGNIRTTKSDRYNVGINMQIPLTFLLSRKNLVRSAALQVKMAEDERDDHAQYITQEVIRLYQEMKLAQKLVIISGKGKQSSFINYDMAEKQFVQANAELDQLSRLHDIYIKASIEYDTYINRFQTAFMQLQAYTGCSLTQLTANVK